MRIAVCFSEDEGDYHAHVTEVVGTLSATLSDLDHVEVATGSMLSDIRSRLIGRWNVGAGAADGRAHAIPSNANIAIIYFVGVPPNVSQAFSTAVALLPYVSGVVILSADDDFEVAAFESSLPWRYRMIGKSLRILHSAVELGDDQAFFEGTASRLRDTGLFETVQLEDIGIRDTVFDDYSGIESALRDAEMSTLASEPDVVEVIGLWLGTEDPRLKETLHAVVERVSSAKTNEQAVQAALSCRRFLEQLADVLFPARSEKFNGRVVGKKEYRNRIWAGIEQRIGAVPGPPLLSELGSQLDDIKLSADRGVHHQPPLRATDVQRICADLIRFLEGLRVLQPPSLKRPWAPHAATLEASLTRWLAEDDGDPDSTE